MNGPLHGFVAALVAVGFATSARAGECDVSETFLKEMGLAELVEFHKRCTKEFTDFTAHKRVEEVFARYESWQKYRNIGVPHLIVGEHKLFANGGTTNAFGSQSDDNGLTERLDKRETTWDIGLGWKGKKALRDVFLAACPNLYADLPPKGFVRSYVIDPIKLDATIGYGRVFTRPTATSPVDFETATKFAVKATYEIGLDTLTGIDID